MFRQFGDTLTRLKNGKSRAEHARDAITRGHALTHASDLNKVICTVLALLRSASRSRMSCRKQGASALLGRREAGAEEAALPAM